MNGIKLDKNYNIVTEEVNMPYRDFLGEYLEILLKAKLDNKINEKEFSFLINIAFKTEFQDEIRTTLFRSKNKPSEKHTMFMQLTNKHIQHV